MLSFMAVGAAKSCSSESSSDGRQCLWCSTHAGEKLAFGSYRDGAISWGIRWNLRSLPTPNHSERRWQLRFTLLRSQPQRLG